MSQRIFKASAPGKLILMGEHAAVYGAPAIVAALDLRTTATLEWLDQAESDDSGQPFCRVELPDLEYARDVPVERLRSYGEECSGPEGLCLVALAVGSEAFPIKSSFKFSLRSEIPIGSGLGSSAALAVATIGVMAHAVGEVLKWEELDELALSIERFQHGQPSGVDSATVLRGGILYASQEQGSSEWRFEPLDPRAPGVARFLQSSQVWLTGAAAESTGVVVQHVAAQRARNVTAFDLGVAEAKTDVETLRALLLERDASLADLIQVVESYSAWLVSLGVVPSPVVSLLTSLRRQGLGSKISGAGSLGGPGAGALLVLGEPAALGKTAQPAAADLKVEILGAALGAPGLRTE